MTGTLTRQDIFARVLMPGKPNRMHAPHGYIQYESVAQSGLPPLDDDSVHAK